MTLLFDSCAGKNCVCMAGVENIKGNKVQLQIFIKWGISNVFGHKEITKNGILYVNYIRLKVCTSNKICVLNHPLVNSFYSWQCLCEQ